MKYNSSFIFHHSITFLVYLIGPNDLVLAFSVNRSFINKEVVFAI